MTNNKKLAFLDLTEDEVRATLRDICDSEDRVKPFLEELKALRIAVTLKERRLQRVLREMTEPYIEVANKIDNEINRVEEKMARDVTAQKTLAQIIIDEVDAVTDFSNDEDVAMAYDILYTAIQKIRSNTPYNEVLDNVRWMLSQRAKHRFVLSPPRRSRVYQDSAATKIRLTFPIVVREAKGTAFGEDYHVQMKVVTYRRDGALKAIRMNFASPSFSIVTDGNLFDESKQKMFDYAMQVASQARGEITSLWNYTTASMFLHGLYGYPPGLWWWTRVDEDFWSIVEGRKLLTDVNESALKGCSDDQEWIARAKARVKHLGLQANKEREKYDKAINKLIQTSEKRMEELEEMTQLYDPCVVGSPRQRLYYSILFEQIEKNKEIESSFEEYLASILTFLSLQQSAERFDGEPTSLITDVNRFQDDPEGYRRIIEDIWKAKMDDGRWAVRNYAIKTHVQRRTRNGKLAEPITHINAVGNVDILSPYRVWAIQYVSGGYGLMMMEPKRGWSKFGITFETEVSSDDRYTPNRLVYGGRHNLKEISTRLCNEHEKKTVDILLYTRLLMAYQLGLGTGG